MHVSFRSDSGLGASHSFDKQSNEFQGESERQAKHLIIRVTILRYDKIYRRKDTHDE